MKKIYLTTLAALLTVAAWSQCETGVTASDTSVCLGDTVNLFGTGPVNMVTTTFGGGNNHRGNMFDIVATNTVTIESFDAHPMGNTDFEIYYKTGTYQGSETNAGAWTLLGSATGVIAQPMGTPTPIPINIGVTIPAGQTYAFYVTSTNTAVSLNYTDGSAVGNVYASDANLQFLEGAGMEYPFAAGGSTFSPRVWNGNIHYSTAIATMFAWSTGSTNASDTVVPAATTTYYCDITPSGCPTVTDSITVTVGSLPIVDLGPDTSACPGTQVSLDAGNPGATYSWNGGIGTQQVFNALPGTSYQVTVTNAEGCSASDTIFVNTQAAPTVDPIPDQEICEGDNTTAINFSGGVVGTTFDWTNSDTGIGIGANGTGDIGVFTGTNSTGSPLVGNFSVTPSASGCTGTPETFTITINPNPTINASNDTTICLNHTVSLDAGAGFMGYLWSSSETTQTILVDGGTVGVGNHSYTVEVTDSNGCSATDTVVVIVDACAGIGELESQGISVYPNPVSDVVNIELEGWNDKATIVLFNMDGKMLNSFTYNGGSSPIELNELASGVYLLEVRSGNRVGKVRIVKN
ncbi:MAG: T9SS type A sorting domain-containing protein [Fluviicola sp.]